MVYIPGKHVGPVRSALLCGSHDRPQMRCGLRDASLRHPDDFVGIADPPNGAPCFVTREQQDFRARTIEPIDMGFERLVEEDIAGSDRPPAGVAGL